LTLRKALIEPVKGPKKGGLARAGAAQDHRQLAALKLSAQVMQDLTSGKADVKTFHHHGGF